MGIIKKAVGGLSKAIGLGAGAPAVAQVLAPPAAPAAEASTPQAPTLDEPTTTNQNTQQARGKRSLTVRRTGIGGGTGVNV